MSRIENTNEVTEALQNAESLDSYTEGFTAHSFIIDDIFSRLSNSVYDMGEILDTDVELELRILNRFQELLEERAWEHLDLVKAEKAKREKL
jgi:hypothetical protein